MTMQDTQDITMQDTQDITPMRLAPIPFLKGIEQKLAERADDYCPLMLIAQRDLDRYYTLLVQSLPAFSQEEASLIVDALAGTLMINPHTTQVLGTWLEGAIRMYNLAEKWGVDGQVLVKRLRALTPFESMAVCDAIERCWVHCEIPMDENLRRVGLVRD